MSNRKRTNKSAEIEHRNGGGTHDHRQRNPYVTHTHTHTIISKQYTKIHLIFPKDITARKAYIDIWKKKKKLRSYLRVRFMGMQIYWRMNLCINPEGKSTKTQRGRDKKKKNQNKGDRKKN